MSKKMRSIVVLMTVISMACVASLAVTAVSDSQGSHSPKSVFAPEDMNAQLHDAAVNCKLLSATYWLNGVKHNLDFANPEIQMTKGSNHVLVISFKSIYNGPEGTKGMAYLWNDDLDYTVWTNMISPGKATTTKVNIPLYFINPGTYNFQLGLISPGAAKFSVQPFSIVVT
jgi:hypothetical protein